MAKVTFRAFNESCERSITLILDRDLSERFANSDNCKQLLFDLYNDDFYSSWSIYYKRHFTRSQIRKLRLFFDVIDNVLWRYVIECTVDS